LHLAFPAPIVIAGRNYWRKRGVREWIAAAASEPPPPPREDDEHLMTQRAVRQACGNVSAMWLWRRRKTGAAA
jgi:hypothetical protein